MPGTFDQLDRCIIHLLQRDGRMSSADVARRLAISERTVRNRIKRLVDDGAIHLTAVVKHQRFGYETAVDIFCEVDIARMDEIGRALGAIPEINYIAYSTGDQDISLQALLASSEAVYPFVQKLASIPGIRRTRTVLVPRILKNTYEWIPTEADFAPYEGVLPPLDDDTPE
jgi:Lrp/AsnC family transcriptional regulator, regulator for asnA, asnC and gidA